MATDSLKSTQSRAATRDLGLGVNEIAAAVLAPLASLKLTVCLLVLAVFVTFIATLDQTRFDIWEVKHKHFENVLVQVPFQTFFVPRWFPDHQNVPGSFYLPSGISILVMMLINLTAAHVLRFRLQAKGIKLAIGVVTALLAAGLTWAVIFNNQNPDGFQAQPPISFSQMWIILQITVLAIACSAAFGFFTIDRKRLAERVLLMIAAGRLWRIYWSLRCYLVRRLLLVIPRCEYSGNWLKPRSLHRHRWLPACCYLNAKPALYFCTWELLV